ncbi:ISLre2 family transposase [Haloimpatiens massiliensis]|uniref:ISLre2 family transposase n=1 Tax=Haloimpatiens massiliensis TaxID=1658110 RepID=UPI000C816E52|nr:ISLre2 family transposase [Haloimpatiens massiliensis]
MYNSIQHFNEFGVKEIKKEIKSFVCERKDIADLIIDLKENLFELGRNILIEVLKDMDDYLRSSGIRKQYYEIIRKDKTSLLTSFGMINYKRTYFKSKQDGKRQYLVDSVSGIEPHDRVSSDVVINAIEEALESSYRKAGEKASYTDKISKQAVMDKIHNVDVVQPKIKESKKRNIRILYVEADEDHVHLQSKNNNNNKQNMRNIAMPKLVYVHEGIDQDKSSKARKVLKNLRYFGGMYKKSEDLWLEVANYIYDQYNTDFIETIYLSGDGASWIREGVNWIPKSKFVLDSYHLSKYLRTATAHLNNELIAQELKDAIDWPDREETRKVFKKIISLTENETKIQAVKEAQRYILNNWDGIEIKADKGYEIIGCSAEGHISHIFSERLSSRPRGWSKIGVSQMSKLLIYKKNGGKIYDLVMAQKIKKKRENKEHIQDKLISELRCSANKSKSPYDISLTAIDRGQKTGLYNALRSIIGM